MEYPDLLNKSLRIRYEAYSNYASALSRATTPQEAVQILAINAKYVLDVYLLRFYHTYSATSHALEIMRGQAQLSTGHQPHAWEAAALADFLPTLKTGEELQNTEFAGSLFDNDRIATLYTLPVQLQPNHTFVISVASKNARAYHESDFRFIRLLGELLANKLSQLTLLDTLTAKHDEVQHANEELSALNEQVHRLNLDLEDKVNQRTQELTSANQELATLFYRTSHDFRRPLTSILGLANLAQHTNNLAEAKQLFAMSAQVVHELTSMLDKLKVLSLHEFEKPTPAPLNGDELLSQLVNKYTPSAQAKQIQLLPAYGQEKPVHTFPHFIEAILENLVENSLNFGRSNGQVTINLSAYASAIVVEVGDDGPGIKPEHHQRIWRMYERAHEDSKGNGLGLYVVKRLTEQLNGRIEFTSTAGKGTTIKIILPTAE